MFGKYASEQKRNHGGANAAIRQGLKASKEEGAAKVFRKAWEDSFIE